MALQGKFQSLAKDLKSVFGEREEVVDGLIVAALAGQHTLLLGPPGTAKSALIRAFSGAVSGASYFEWLLTKFSAPEELFGPVSLNAIKQDKYQRITTGKLPEAHVAFLDEIFKANSAVLNSLLAVVNERKFHNGSGAVDVPLRLCVGASNELPEGPELAALYDRFPMRFWVDYVRSPNTFEHVLGLNDQALAPKAAITLKEWDEARKQVSKVVFDKAMAQEFYKLRVSLGKEGISVSDRRWVRAAALVKAKAWYAGDTSADNEHLAVLRNVLWNDQAQIATVAKQVDGMTTSATATATATFETLKTALAQIDIGTLDMTKRPDQEKMIAATREGQRGLAKLQELALQARTPRHREKIQKLTEDARALCVPFQAAARRSLEI